MDSRPAERRPTTSAPPDVVIFRIDGLRCGLDAASVREILPALAVRPLPGQPAFIAGTIDLRGMTVPVLDLRVRFGGTARSMRLSDRLIVAQAHGRALAIWVDDVEELLACAPEALTPREGLLVGDRSLTGVATTAGGLTALHDLDGFLTQCESDALTATA
jgi:chemotaxis signal transduction protein